MLDGLMQRNLSQAKMLKAHLGILRNSAFSTIRAGRSKYIPVFETILLKSASVTRVTSHFFPYSLNHDILPEKFDTQAQPQGALAAGPQVQARPPGKACRLRQARPRLPLEAGPPHASQAKGGRAK